MTEGASKVVVVEEEPQVPSITALPTSVTGAIGIAERGPIDTPVLCRTFDDYKGTFGGFTPNSDLALAAWKFFENEGSDLWVVRTTHHEDISDPESTTAALAQAALTVGDDNQQALILRARSAGSWGNRIEARVLVAASGSGTRFDLVINEDGVFREVFRDVATAPGDDRYAVRLLSSSRFVSVQDLGLAGAPVPGPQIATLVGGDDGLVGLGDSDFNGYQSARTGFFAFDTVDDLSLLLAPGRATAGVHNGLVDYCQSSRQGFVFGVLDSVLGADALAIANYVSVTALLENYSEFGALYWPWVRVPNPDRSVFGSADEILAPPSGAVGGVFARTDGSRPGGIYQAPAGVQIGRLRGVVGFETPEVLDERARDLVYPRRVNPLNGGVGRRPFIDGSRTLRGNGHYPDVGSRRGVSFIERSLRRGLEFARHQKQGIDTDDGLRREVRRVVRAFLAQQLDANAFASRDPKKAFYVDVDSLNTPSSVRAGRFVLRVGLAMSRPAEFVELRILAVRPRARRVTPGGTPMTVIGHPLTFHQKNLFTIEIDGLGRAAFARCSELSFEVAKIEYWAGGSLIPHKAPGRLTYPDVTLERGVTGDLGLFNWFNEVANVATGVGFANPGFKHGVELIQHERDETILRRWHLVNAWPVKFVAGEWSGDADEILMEQVVLTFDYPELLQ